MNHMITKLIGQNITVTLRSTVPTPVKGKLLACDAVFLILEQDHGQVIIPLTSVLHFCAPH